MSRRVLNCFFNLFIIFSFLHPFFDDVGACTATVAHFFPFSACPLLRSDRGAGGCGGLSPFSSPRSPASPGRGYFSKSPRPGLAGHAPELNRTNPMSLVYTNTPPRSSKNRQNKIFADFLSVYINLSELTPQTSDASLSAAMIKSASRSGVLLTFRKHRFAIV